MNNNELIIIGKKNIKIDIRKIKNDSYKKIIYFFRKWISVSQYYTQLRKI